MNDPVDDRTGAAALAKARQLLASRLPREALAEAQAVLRADLANGDALRIAAAAHRALGEGENALRAEMAAIAASQRDPAMHAIARELDRGEFVEASRLAAEHLRRVPGDLAALTLSAESAIALGLPDKAEPLLREVLHRAPAFSRARELLLNALMQMDCLTEARALLLAMTKMQPDDETALRLLARIESELGDFAAAATAGERIIQSAKATPEDWVNYGESLRFAGRKSDTAAIFRKAQAMDPAYGRAWWNLADLDARAMTDDDVAHMERALASRREDPEHAGNLHFALGIAYDTRQQHEPAFTHFAAGNLLRSKAQPYSPEETSEPVARYLAALSPNLIPAPSEIEGPVPIFVIGMPRSGSTLLERILGRHSRIEALGELSIVPHMVMRLKRDQAPEEMEARVTAMDTAELATLGQWYIDRAREHCRTDKPFFTDKLHMNWRHLPLILRMLPQARIIDVRRNAMDCCWSNFKTLFARGHPAASDLRDIGRFFADYVRLTDQLRTWAPGRVHFLSYEELVDDFDNVAGTAFAALGLDFESQCRDFHLSREPVATASSEQVRRPLNRDGIGAWRPYEPWLGPLQEALGQLAIG